MGLLSRFIGVVISPSATFLSVVAHPKWLGMLALTCGLVGLLVGGYLMTKAGQDAWLDAAIDKPAFWPGQRRQYAAMQRMRSVRRLLRAAADVRVPAHHLCRLRRHPLFVFNVMTGGNATFKQLFAVVAHTGPIGVLAQLFTVPMNYFQRLDVERDEPRRVPADDRRALFLGRLLGMIDVFLVWWLVVLAIGLGVLYRRRTQPIAITLFAVYARHRAGDCRGDERNLGERIDAEQEDSDRCGRR